MTDVSDIDICDLINALWENAKPAAFFDSFDAISNGVIAPNSISKEEIEDELKKDDGYIEYLKGRRFKTNFSDLSNVDSFGYDQVPGKGTFDLIVAKLRG